MELKHDEGWQVPALYRTGSKTKLTRFSFPPRPCKVEIGRMHREDNPEKDHAMRG